MAPVAIPLAVAGLATQVYGQVAGGRAADKAAKENAKAAQEEARVREEIQREHDRRTMASARATYGASGVTMTGSPLEVLAESARQAELSAQRIRRGGQLEAEAQLRAGKQAKQAGYLGGLGSLLTGGAGISELL